MPQAQKPRFRQDRYIIKYKKEKKARLVYIKRGQTVAGAVRTVRALKGKRHLPALPWCALSGVRRALRGTEQLKTG